MKIKITVKITRYQKEKLWGDFYRLESEPGESFTEFKQRKKEEFKSAQSLNDETAFLLLNGTENLIRKINQEKEAVR